MVNLCAKLKYHDIFPLRTTSFDCFDTVTVRYKRYMCLLDTVISEHELTFTLAICCHSSVCLTVCLSSVCHLSVCNARAPYLDGCNFRQYIYGIWYLAIDWHPWKILRRLSQGESISWRIVVKLVTDLKSMNLHQDLAVCTRLHRCWCERLSNTIT